MITKDKLVTIANKMETIAQILSKQLNHGDWFPCGSAYLQVSGTSPIVKFLKSNPVDPFRISKVQRGYWLSIRHQQNDAFECQSLKYSLAIYSELQKLLLNEGIESDICSYVD